MAATKVSKDGNFLVIDIDGGKKTYYNALWFDLRFYLENTATLRYHGGKNLTDFDIAFSDFQDGDGVAINTEADIVNYLKDKIG